MDRAAAHHTEQLARARRFGPPAALAPPGRRIRALLVLLWLACFVVALLVQVAATWRSYVAHGVIQPAFASIGLVARSADDHLWHLSPSEGGSARASGVRNRSLVYRVNGVAVGRGLSAEEVARLVEGPDGGTVTIGLVRPNALRVAERPPREFRLVRTAENRAHTFAYDKRGFRIASQAMDLAIALLMLGVATMLRLRKFGNPVGVILSFALLFAAMPLGTWRLWDWLGMSQVPQIINFLWMSLLLVAAPALPNGLYRPRWSRWVMLAGPGAALAVVLTGIAGEAWAVRSVIASVVLCLLLRFRYTARGSERQRLKWALLGFGIGILLVFGGDNLAAHLPAQLDDEARYLNYALTRLGYGVMALGLLPSMLGYRLNDVDAAIGRSVVYTLLTVIVAVFWAVSMNLTETAIRRLAGPQGTWLVTAISTLLALAIFAPARARINGWIDKRYRGALARLRVLPERIARWQHEDDPRLVAARALTAIADSIDATSAAIVARNGDGAAEILAVRNVEPAVLRGQLGGGGTAAIKAAFPVRLDGAGDGERGLTLLIGPRGDGASYGREERAAMAAVIEPLADALRTVAQRAARRDALEGLLAEVAAPLRRGASGTGGPDAATPRANRSRCR